MVILSRLILAAGTRRGLAGHVLLSAIVVVACIGSFVFPPALTAQDADGQSRLRQIIVLDDDKPNPHLKKAEELFLDSENAVDRTEGMRLAQEGIGETFLGLREVMPRDGDNEPALRLRRNLLDATSNKGQLKVVARFGGEYGEFLKASETGDCETAAKLSPKILEAVPEFTYAHIILGDAFFHNRDYKTALKHYEAAAKKDADDARAFTRIADCYDGMDQPEQALSCYIQSVIVHPGSAALIRSLETYAYSHDYRVLLNRVPRLARVVLNEEGRLKVAVQRVENADVAAAWLTFGLTKFIRLVEYLKQNPGQRFEPSFDCERSAFEALLKFWGEAKAQNSRLQDEDLDFLMELKKNQLLDAFIYVRYFRPEFQDSYALWRKSHAQEVRALFEKHLVVIDVNQVKLRDAFKLYAQAKYQPALEEFRQAAEGFTRGRDPGNKKSLARCLVYMGRCARTLGRTQEALRCHETAKRFFQELRYQDGLAQLLNSLGLSYMALGRFDDAESAFQESLAVAKKRRVLEAEVAALVSLANVHLSRGNLTAAQEVSTEALGKAKRSPDKDLAAPIYSNLGDILRARGEFTKAREQIDLALRGARVSKDHKLETTVLSNLSDLLLGLGDAVTAERYLRQALAKARAVNDRDGEGTILSNLSAAARDRGDIEAAYDLQLASFKIRKEIGNPYHEAHNLLSLGGFSWDLGRAEEARQFWSRALEIGRTLKSQGLACAALNNLATSAEDWKAGLSYTQEALAVVAGRRLPASGSDPYPDPDKAVLLGHAASVRTLLANKGQILMLAAKIARAEENDEKEKCHLHQARRSLALAVELTEDVRTGIDETEFRISFLGSGMAPYEALVEVLLRLDGLEKSGGWGMQAFLYSERSKSRALADLLRESQAKKLAGIPDNELKQAKELELQIGAVQAEIAKEQFPEGRERLQNQLAQQVESFRKFREGLKLKYPRYAALNRADVTSAEHLQKMLDGNTILLEYFTGHDFIACWAITRNDVRSFVVPKSVRISDKIEDYQSALMNPNVSFTSSRPDPTDTKPDEDPAAVGQQLFQQLIAPALEGAGKVKRLVIIPDGLLSRLPFEALIIGARENRPLYLVDRFAVSYAPSATVFAAVKGSATNKTFPEKLFAMGRPAYNRKNRPPDPGKVRPDELLRLAKRGSIEEPIARLRQAVGLEGITLEDLPGTGREVDNIGQILRRSEFIFKSEQATERRVKEFSRRGKLKEFQYLHFAAHGLVPDMAPGLASIALAQDADPTEDGFLTVGEIYGLELGCDLVTVSACKVGLGQMVRGEGVVGLTRAFLYAGARSVAVTLWSISDDATPLLMKHFYTNLNQGMARDEALRQAKLALMHESFTDRSGQTANLSHPFYWAPFVICGNAQ